MADIDAFLSRAGIKNPSGQKNKTKSLKERFFITQKYYDDIDPTWLERLISWTRRKKIAKFKSDINTCVNTLSVSDAKFVWYAEQVKLLRERNKAHKEPIKFDPFEIAMGLNNIKYMRGEFSSATRPTTEFKRIFRRNK